MPIVMDELTDEQKDMDNVVLKATVEYIVSTVSSGTEYDEFSILPDMIRQFIELRKELY